MILSIPKLTHYIFKNSEYLGDGYYKIHNDPVREGAIFKGFKNQKDIKSAFAQYFENFKFASLKDDCFGLAYDFWLIVCQKRASGGEWCKGKI